MHYYDLDGTLNTLNSTFDFIKPYHRYHKHFVRYFLGTLAEKIIPSLFLLSFEQKRRLNILVWFYGTHKSSLESYFESHYKQVFLKHLTPLGEKIMKKRQKNAVLLTGCTQIPALQIAKLFGFEKVVSTTFKGNPIQGIQEDTFGNYKLSWIKPSQEKKIYYTDDRKREWMLNNYMDEVHFV